MENSMAALTSILMDHVPYIIMYLLQYAPMATNWKRITFPLLTLPVPVGSVKMRNTCELFQTLFSHPNIKEKSSLATRD